MNCGFALPKKHGIGTGIGMALADGAALSAFALRHGFGIPIVCSCARHSPRFVHQMPDMQVLNYHGCCVRGSPLESSLYSSMLTP